MKTYFNPFYWAIVLSVFFTPVFAEAGESTHLVDRLQGAQEGDYIVTAIDNTYSLILIKEKSSHVVVVEEVTIPAGRLQNKKFQWFGWKKWLECGAPGHTSWVMYTIHCSSGKVDAFFSYTKNSWCDMTEANNFISKLMNLRLVRIPASEVKKVGPPPPEGSRDTRRIWAPKMVFEGNEIDDVSFIGWRTRWPSDTSELSGKSIAVYLPADEKKYPSYFPYWLEIQGLFGKAKVRIIDSGRGIQSPRESPPKMRH